MNSAGDLSRKYAVGKVAELMIACNGMIFNIQEKVHDVSRLVGSMEEDPAIRTKSSTSFGHEVINADETTPTNRITNSSTPPGPKNVEDPHLRKLYQELINLEGVGRLEWLRAFMYISSYMKIPRPVARGEWDEPKKFVRRQTITLDGPYPGISDDLIVSDDSKPSATSFGKTNFVSNPRMRSSTCFAPDCDWPSKTAKKTEPEELRGSKAHREFPTKPSSLFRKPRRSETRAFCDCLEIVPRSPKVPETRRKQLVERVRTK